MNNITIYGRLTKDIEIKTLQSGKSIGVVNVASNGRNKDEVNYFECKAFGGAADILAKYLKKGDGIVIYGFVNQYAFEKQDGTKQRTFDIIIEDFDFVQSNKKSIDQPKQQTLVVEEENPNLPF